MILLRFTFSNHRSFRGEAELTLMDSRFATNKPPKDKTWGDYTHRVAAIYGANASGKSSVVDAFAYFQAILRQSATSWSDRKKLPRGAFALDRTTQKEPSNFVIDFVVQGVRHQYGFSVTEDSIEEEWLYAYPLGKKSVLFERDSPGELRFGRSLKGGASSLLKILGKRELVLSKGARSNYAQLAVIFEELTDHLSIARFEELDKSSRLERVVADVVSGELTIDDVQTMLRVADVGILGAEVAEQEQPEEFKRILRAMMVAMNSDEANGGNTKGGVGDGSDDELEAILSQAARSLMFVHGGAGGETYRLPTQAQSAGTLTWLSLCAPALRVLRIGGVLVIDELDASLHPQLAQVMVQMFRDERINPNGSQVVFTTHDTYFISPTSEVALGPEEIWIVEKDAEGASHLFSVSDFPTREGENLSRRYLHGRYGGVPSVAPSFLAGLACEVAPDHPSHLELDPPR